MRGALNHPVPPILETIPAALLSTSSAFNMLAHLLDNREGLRKATRYSALSGLLAVGCTSAFGVLDYVRKNPADWRVVPRRDLWSAAIVADYALGLSLRIRGGGHAERMALLLSGLGAALIGLSRYQSEVKLTPEAVEDAFRSGTLAAADKWGRVGFYRAGCRSILEPEALHVEKNLARRVRKDIYSIRINQDFVGTVRGCADRQSTWISEEIIQAYTILHLAGKAHSVEAYQGSVLVGGLYGIALGGAFRVESQFHRARDASKICFVHLVNRLRERGYALLDLWVQTEHLARFGAEEIPEKEYLIRLNQALRMQPKFA
jgi:leucyl/phenylalanyl-tRNA--protein transferase